MPFCGFNPKMIRGLGIFAEGLFEATVTRAKEEGKTIPEAFEIEMRDIGLFLQLTCDGGGGGEPDVAIPGTDFGFRTLAAAQALGDFEALRAAGRRVARVDLSPDAEGGLLRMLAEL